MKKFPSPRVLLPLMALLLALLLILPAGAITPYKTPSAAYRVSPYYSNLTSLELTGDQRTDLILVALSQLGYHEGNSDTEMHGLNAEGSRNFVEYNRLHGQVDNGEGNGVSYGYYWCCSFATWCARNAGISLDVVPNEISCWRLIDNHFKPMGIYHPVSEGYTPIAGDYIFFRGDDALPGAPSDHIGIVLYVDGKTVHTIEGNSIYQSVAVRSYSLSDSYIVGYASPAYETDESVAMDFNPRTGGYALRTANYFVTATALHVREGNGVQYDSLGQLSFGDLVVLLEVQGNWGRIRYEDGYGWISLGYIQYVPTPVTDAPPSCTVTFEVGSAILDRVTIDDGAALTLPSLPERASADPTGYVWAPQGWDSNGDNLADLMAGESYTPDGDITLSAVYTRTATLYTVRFYGADDVLIKEQQCAYNSLPTPPDMSLYAPEDGREFDGWDSVIIAVTEDMDYHAVYSAPLTFTIRFLGDDGSVLSEQTLLAGEMPVPPPDRELLLDDGSVFLGWDAEIVPAAADMDYHPLYEQRLDQTPDPDDPEPPEQPLEPNEPPSVVIVLLVCGGVLLLLAALSLALHGARRGRNTDEDE
ncbi:MAG: CHAP domain-containing protein [Clostridia bacterium]|nr:CHAP domain-containing protein [Clostridia bacterium]